MQTVRVVVTDGTFTSTSGTASADAGYAQNLSFVNSGFRITDAGAAPVAATIATQTAGTSSAIYGLQAIRTDTSSGACVGVFASDADVALDLAFQCNNPTTCVAGQNVTITNNGVSTTIASNPNSGVATYSTRSLRFGANSQALFSLNYPDVGAISLYARYQIPLGTGAGSGNFMTGVSNQFVVKPAGFTLSNIVRTADGFANPAAANAAGSLFVRAGSSFTATVTAVNSIGAATPNYGRESIPEGVTLSPALVGGLGLTNNPALTNATAFGAFSAGAATGTTFSWGEVGIITLAASVADGDYLGVGNITGAASGNVGRFAPFDFAVTRNSPSFNPACSGNFTYVGQPFNYSTAPVLAVTAPNSAGATTQNYAGSFGKVTNATVTPNTTALRYSRFDALGAGTTPALDVSAMPTAASDPTIGAFVNGAGMLTFSGGGTGAVFTRSLEVVPFNADIALSISLSDTDGTLVASIDGAAGLNPVTFGAATSGNGISFAGAAKQMRFGRLVLGNAFGSELLDLPLPM
ncbi:MAG TPA: DUF6701 domain-containing protein, partial [Burkholderiales bacterium]